MLLDAHAHLDKYGEKLNAALEEIKRHHVFTIAVAMDVPSYQRGLEIGEMCEFVRPTFGVHPKKAPEYADRLSEMSPLIEQSPAIGEIGLDYHWVEDRSRYPAQRKVLEYFLAAAKEQNKIVNLHTKGAEKEILNLLEHYDIRRAIVHWYSGPLDILRAMVKYGAYFTVGVELPHSSAIQAMVKEIPNHLLLTETDNPGGLKWLKGVVGMPSAVKDVIQTLADVKQLPAHAVARIVRKNFLRLIDNDPWLQDVRLRFSEVRYEDAG